MTAPAATWRPEQRYLGQLEGDVRVLVTGSDGCIGAVLVPWLARAGHEVVGLDSSLFAGCTFGPEPEAVQTMVIDVRDIGVDDLRGFEARAWRCWLGG